MATKRAPLLLPLVLALALTLASAQPACPDAGGRLAPNATTVLVSPTNNSEAWVLHPDCKLDVVPVTVAYDSGVASTELRCTEKGIRRVESLPPAVQRLYFDNNLATAADFSNYTKLIHIILAWCNLEEVDAFKFPSSLFELDFEGNPIKGIAPGTIPPSVQYLYLGEASISSLANYSIPNSLTYLSLVKNKLTTIDFRIPSRLTTLILDQNEGLRIIQNFTMPDSLTSFSCINCKTRTFRGVQLSMQLEMINFDGCNFTDFELRESDVEVFQQAEFRGYVAQASCKDPNATLTSVRDGVGICVLSDTAFEAKFPARLQPAVADQPPEKDDEPISLPPPTTPAPRADSGASSSSSLSTTVIVVAVVAGVAGIVLAVAAYRMCCGANASCRNLTDKYTDASTLDQHGSSALTVGSGPASLFAPNEYLSNDVRNDEALIPYRIAYDEIQIVRLIAKGGFGIIHLGKFRGREVAVKKILPAKAKETATIRSFMDEIRLCSLLEHPKIVEFIGLSWSTLLDVAVVIEYMAGGDLNAALQVQHLRKQTPGEWFAASSDLKAKALVAIDIVDALVYLHSFDVPIIHRDLKSRNVLLDGDGDAKLSDFGVSREVTLDQTMTGDVGTVAWIAPEVLQGERYSEKADIYSLGVILVELDTAQHPYRRQLVESSSTPTTNTRIALLVSTGRLVPATLPECPLPIKALVSRCLSYDPADRPSAMDVNYELRKILNRSKS